VQELRIEIDSAKKDPPGRRDHRYGLLPGAPTKGAQAKATC
jgi:hypothetical protein